MDLNQKVIDEALTVGLKLLSAEDVTTPNAWNRPLAALETILVGLIQGQLELRAAVPTPTQKMPDSDVGKGAEELSHDIDA